MVVRRSGCFSGEAYRFVVSQQGKEIGLPRRSIPFPDWNRQAGQQPQFYFIARNPISILITPEDQGS